MTTKLLFSFLLTWLLASCSHYSFRNPSNPFHQYGIRSISVPMFLNETTLPLLGGAITSEIVPALSRFKGLKIYAGENQRADAVLLGIITSERSLKKTIARTFYNTSKRLAPSSVSKRGEFFIPYNFNIEVNIRFVLIKNPNYLELELLKKSISQNAISPKIVFNETLTIQTSYNREIFDQTADLDGGTVNMTQGQGAIRKAIGNLAIQAANLFTQQVVYAF